jgi:hypothetical protein
MLDCAPHRSRLKYNPVDSVPPSHMTALFRQMPRLSCYGRECYFICELVRDDDRKTAAYGQRDGVFMDKHQRSVPGPGDANLRRPYHVNWRRRRSSSGATARAGL